ncbi:hypothetical protein AB0M36_10435 [Actinoplanes sp. NPDC051346]|uniref:hypothetical protein n=1 Tax=Actinoplanes sp. NPDC051346 TaxID=3155048 RepID=UPI003430F31B
MSGKRRAAVIIVAVLSTVSAGCTKGSTPGSQPTATASSDPAGKASATVTVSRTPTVRVTPPAVLAGEIVRTVFSDKSGTSRQESTVRADPRAGQEYWLRAACTSPTPGKTLAFKVVSAKVGAPDTPLVSGTVPCDGTVTANGIGTLPAEPIMVDLEGDHTDVTSAYALITPMRGGLDD